MVEADLDRVVGLERLIFTDEPWPRDCFPVGSPQPETICLVAEQAGTVVGYLVALAGAELHVANIAVAPEARRQGIGRLLMAAAEEHGRRHDARRAALEVRDRNSAAIAFYRRLGYEPAGRLPAYYRTGEDAVVMTRRLGGEETPAVGRQAPDQSV